MKKSYASFRPPLLFLSLALLSAPLIVWGQSPSSASVSGIVVEKTTKEPMEFVNVLLQHATDQAFSQGMATNKKGEFNFAQVAPGDYFLEISFVGFETRKTKVFSVNGQNQKLDFGKVDIQMNPKLLEEIEVLGEKSTFSHSLDRKVFNVGKDITSQTSSVTEMLRNLPSVRVDMNGQVSLRGTPNITFFINGKPSALFRSNSTGALQQIPASSVERIEVITNPSAKYRPDGVGGIINIVLKQPSLEGWNTALQGSVGNLQRYNANVTFNYNKNKVNFFTTYGFKNASTPQDIFDLRIERDGNWGTLGIFEEESEATFDQFSHILNTGLNFPLGKGGLVEIAGEYFYGKNDNRSFSNWRVTDELTSLFNIDRTYDGFEKEYEFSATYEREFGNEDHSLSIDFTYGGYDESEDNLYDEKYLSPLSGASLSRNLIEKGGPIAEFSVEYARPLGEDSELEAGYVGEFIRDDVSNFAEFLNGGRITDYNRTNQFKFNQDIHAFYALFGHSIDELGFQAGLRAEQALVHSTLDSKTLTTRVPNNYFRLYPTLGVTYELADNEEVRLSYSRRVNRPDSDEHNPFPEYTDPRTRDSGNPRLKPENVHSVELGYSLQKRKFTFLSALYYRYTYDGFTEFREIVDDTILHTSLTNLAVDQAAGLEFVFSGSVSEKLRMNFSANGFFNRIDASNLGFPEDKSNFSWDLNLAANVNLTKSLVAQVNTQYISTRLTPQGEFRPLFLMNLGLRQDILKNKASILFTISDVFASLEWESNINTPELTWKTTYGRNEQIFHLGFTYRFGGFFNKNEGINFEDDLEIPNPILIEE